MRLIKEADERKNDILDAAEELFATKGYDSTSTGDILEKVGIARGTLYYHFKSKEDILDALIGRTTDTLVANVKAVVSADMPVTQQISAFIRAMKVDTPIAKELASEVHKPQNALLHQKMQKSLLDSITPLAAELIKSGIEKGVFSTEHPYAAAEMIILYSNIAFDDLNDISMEKRQEKVTGFIYNMERLLGVATGSQLNLAEMIG